MFKIEFPSWKLDFHAWNQIFTSKLSLHVQNQIFKYEIEFSYLNLNFYIWNWICNLKSIFYIGNWTVTFEIEFSSSKLDFKIGNQIFWLEIQCSCSKSIFHLETEFHFEIIFSNLISNFHIIHLRNPNFTFEI